MVSKLVSSLNSMNTFSKKIIISVSIISLVLCIVGMGIILYNASCLEVVSLHTIGSTMIYSSVVIFTEFIVGSLAIDFFNMLISNHDDD